MNTFAFIFLITFLILLIGAGVIFLMDPHMFTSTDITDIVREYTFYSGCGKVYLTEDIANKNCKKYISKFDWIADRASVVNAPNVTSLKRGDNLYPCSKIGSSKGNNLLYLYEEQRNASCPQSKTENKLKWYGK